MDEWIYIPPSGSRLTRRALLIGVASIVTDSVGANLALRKRRRSIFRSLFYREYPFAVLDPVQLTTIFEAFVCVVRLYRAVVYWVHRLNDEEYLVTHFQHRSMIGYSGRELVHVTPNHIGYYRLPGAKAGGRGTVEPGVYRIAIQSPDRHRQYVRLCKCEFGQLHLEEVTPYPLPDTERYLPLNRYVLNRSKFADEMTTIVERGIEWGYQQALSGEPDGLHDAQWTELTGKCAGLSGKIDALLHACARLRRRDP